ncbi:hypothetical protein [uncultured Hoeflea sp.]|uniref:hypothetical protein n=1 Tax=uncultured Hoeflea sp. TaxID=538666 RepID=UPI0030EC3599
MKTVVVYCTMPIGKIVGEFDIDSILADFPEKIWDETQEGSGITKGFFDEYFSGRDIAYALKIGDVREYDEHVDPKEVLSNFTPPQSYMYMKDERIAQNSREQLDFW